jgi:carbon storage regulator CsrA
MLVLTRKLGEKVVIGNNITVTILAVDGGRVRVGIDAPDDIRILRGELAFWMEPDFVGAGNRSAECTIS